MPLPAVLIPIARALPDQFICRHSVEQMRLASLNLNKWPDGRFPWTVMSNLPNVPLADLKAAADRGLSRWRPTKRIDPQYVVNARDARLLIYTANLDGPGNVLADCELPSGSGQVRMRLDVGESWGFDLTNLQRQIALELVIWHEGGHGLGLGHAPQGSANIMAPIYNPKQLVLGAWDQSEIVARYPQEIITATPTNPVPIPAGDSNSMLTNLLGILSKIGPVLTFLAANKDQLPAMMNAMKAIWDAFNAAQPQKLMTEAALAQLTLERSTLVSLIQGGIGELKILASITATTTDDQIVAFLETALTTPWVIDLLNNVIAGKLVITEASLAQALKASA